MRLPDSIRRLGLLAGAVAVSIGPARALEVGRFALVQNEVTSLKPRATEAVAALPGGIVELDEIERTGPASAAKMTFGDHAVISVGQKTRFKITREAVEEARGESTSMIDLLAGKARVFVSRLRRGQPEVRVNTPTAVVGIKGSEVVIDVGEDGGTVVTVIAGSASVATTGDGREARSLGPSDQVTVSTGADAPGEVSQVEDEEIDRLRRETEPRPSAPRGAPENPPTQSPPAGAVAGSAEQFATSTTSTSSAGSVVSSPASSSLPQRVDSPASKPPQKPPQPVDLPGLDQNGEILSQGKDF